MSGFTNDSPVTAPSLKRENVEAMLASLSREVGASFQLDDQNSVALSYYDDEEATLVFFESPGLLVLVAPVADPASIELPRLDNLLELNMEWRLPCAIITPDNDPRAHLAMILPVDPNDPSSLEFWLVKGLNLAGKTSCAANAVEVQTSKAPAGAAMA